jgi:hypothetical protein
MIIHIIFVTVIMGCSTSLVERTQYFDSGELLEHYYIFNGKCCGLSTQYHRNGTIRQICNYNNNTPYGPFMTFFEDETLLTYGHYINNTLCEYKEYDIFGSLVQYVVINFYRTNKEITEFRAEFHAEFMNNKLCTYIIEYRYSHTFRTIYNTTNKYNIILKSSIINGIIHLQKCFKRRKYTPIINILNTIIGINDISQLVISYITKN